MTTDPLVQAATEAMAATTCRCGCPYLSPGYERTAAAVDAVVPLLRAQIAAEIRQGCLAAGDGWREGRARTDLCTACAASARIAEGTTP